MLKSKLKRCSFLETLIAELKEHGIVLETAMSRDLKTGKPSKAGPFLQVKGDGHTPTKK